MNHIQDNHQNHDDGSNQSVVSCNGHDGSIMYETDCSYDHIMEDDEEFVEHEVVIEVHINDEGEEVSDMSDENTDDVSAVQVARQIVVEIVMNAERIMDI